VLAALFALGRPMYTIRFCLIHSGMLLTVSTVGGGSAERKRKTLEHTNLESSSDARERRVCLSFASDLIRRSFGRYRLSCRVLGTSEPCDVSNDTHIRRG
jgi:hypothetical protein